TVDPSSSPEPEYGLHRTPATPSSVVATRPFFACGCEARAHDRSSFHEAKKQPCLSRRRSVIPGTSIIAQWFEQYVDAFHTLDPATALSYLHVPCLFLGPRGVRVMVSDAENEAFLANVMGDLKARDYSHSEITDF